MAETEVKRTIYAGNLSENVSEDLLYELTLQAGPIESVKIAQDRLTGKQKNFGFVCYQHEATVPYAIHLLNGTRLCDRGIVIQNRDKAPIEDREFVGVHKMDAIEERGSDSSCRRNTTISPGLRKRLGRRSDETGDDMLPSDRRRHTRDYERNPNYIGKDERHQHRERRHRRHDNYSSGDHRDSYSHSSRSRHHDNYSSGNYRDRSSHSSRSRDHDDRSSSRRSNRDQDSSRYQNQRDRNNYHSSSYQSGDRGNSYGTIVPSLLGNNFPLPQNGYSNYMQQGGSQCQIVPIMQPQFNVGGNFPYPPQAQINQGYIPPQAQINQGYIPPQAQINQGYIPPQAQINQGYIPPQNCAYPPNYYQGSGHY